MFLNVLLNAFFPPVCPVCATRIETPGALCAECFSRLQFIHAHQPGKASAVVYDDTSKQLILALKYGDKTELAPLLARMMVNAGKEVLDGADLLTCVPLHWKRLLARKYNQAAVLASAVSKICAVPSDPLMLKRIKATPKQGTRRERFENVKDAFAFNPDRPVKGKIIVLVDDVVTTGATADACARELLKNGAGEVRLLTFAKAVGKN